MRFRLHLCGAHLLPSNVLFPPINPDAWVKTQPGIPLILLSSSSLTPRHAAKQAERTGRTAHIVISEMKKARACGSCWIATLCTFGKRLAGNEGTIFDGHALDAPLAIAVLVQDIPKLAGKGGGQTYRRTGRRTDRPYRQTGSQVRRAASQSVRECQGQAAARGNSSRRTSLT